MKFSVYNVYITIYLADIGYIYQSMAELKKELEESLENTQEYSNDEFLDATLAGRYQCVNKTSTLMLLLETLILFTHECISV